MINFFTGIWPKISMAFALIIGVLFLRGKYQSNKIEVLEHENKIITKASKIAESQSTFKARVLADESESVFKLIEETKNNAAKKSKFDRLNDL
jgi:thiamine biosynthesis lipoprotein ApbE